MLGRAVLWRKRHKAPAEMNARLYIDRDATLREAVPFAEGTGCARGRGYRGQHRSRQTRPARCCTGSCDLCRRLLADGLDRSPSNYLWRSPGWSTALSHCNCDAMGRSRNICSASAGNNRSTEIARRERRGRRKTESRVERKNAPTKEDIFGLWLVWQSTRPTLCQLDERHITKPITFEAGHKLSPTTATVARSTYS